MIASLEDVLKERGIPYRRGVLSATLCSFHIGGPAALVIEPSCLGELIDALLLCKRFGKPFAVIGKGSNLFFGDGIIKTVLIRTTTLCGARFLRDDCVRALCGTSISHLAALAAQQGLSGLSFAAGIPGTLGGALFMNAGAYGKEMSDVVKSVDFFDLDTEEITTLFHQKLNYSYRNSVFQAKNGVILSAELSLGPNRDRAEILREMRALCQKRRATQPLDFPSAGSAFRRFSADAPLSKLLDTLGLKGKRVGGAAVSQKHAGFIVNLGGATARDVMALIEEIQNIVEGACGAKPIPEIRFIPSE